VDEHKTNIASGGETAAETSEPSPASQPAAAQASEPAYQSHEPAGRIDRGPSGQTIQADVPHPELLGRYNRENVLSYAKGASDQQNGYDLNAALQGVIADSRPQVYAQFVQNIPAEHLPGVVDLARNFIAHDPESVIRELIAQNHLPSWILPPAQGIVDPGDPAIAELSPELREIALGLDPAVWDQLALMDPQVRDRQLRQEMELAQIKQREYEQRATAAVEEWNRQLDAIDDDTGYAIIKAVVSLRPFTEDAANEQAQDMCVLATAAQCSNDPYLRNLREVVDEALRLAAEDRWRGNEKLAEGREHHARRLNEILIKEFKEKLDVNIKQFQLFFQHAPGRRQDAPAQDQPQSQFIN
jgi:hypothetical protein